MADLGAPRAPLNLPRVQKLSQHIADVIKDRILIGEFPEKSVLPSPLL